MIVGLKGEAKEVYFRFLSSYPGEENVAFLFGGNFFPPI